MVVCAFSLPGSRWSSTVTGPASLTGVKPHSRIMQFQEHLLLDTGRLPLWLRLPILLVGVFILWLSAHIASSHLLGYDLGLHTTNESGSPVLGFVLTLGLGLFFVSVWFLRNRIVFDSDRGEVVIHHSGLFGRSRRRISLAGASAVYVHHARLLASTFWDIGVEFGDGRREWLTRVYAEADDVIRVFSESTKLPVVRV